MTTYGERTLRTGYRWTVRSAECQRVYGALLSRLAGTCGRRGRYFAPRVPREPVGLVSAWHAECGSCGHVGPVVLADGDWECAACGREVTT